MNCRKEYMAEYRRKNREQIAKQKREWRKSPEQRYATQQEQAKARGIPWHFTFETWWALWAPHWEERGKAKGKLQMCRYGDSGPYSPDNVRLDTLENNVKERHQLCT